MAYTDDLLAAYHAAMVAVSGATRVRQSLEQQPLPPGPVAVLAVGKAAAAMAEGARQALGARIQRGLIICPSGHAPDSATAIGPVMTSAHPIPDERSLQAGQALVDFVAQTPASQHLLVLLSGGTSSLVELPLPGVSLSTLAELNRQLLAEGHDIATINAARGMLSRIKGGRLGYWLDGRPATVLAISDVPGNALHVIGSGLLHPNPRPPRLPPALARRLRRLADARANPAPAPDDPRLAGVQARIVADNAMALRGAADWLRRAGYAVRCQEALLSGEVRWLAAELGRALRAPEAAGMVVVMGGEPTVRLPPTPGRGGRMHALVAALGLELQDRDGWAVLGGGTDGADGNAGHAGAMLDDRRAAQIGTQALAQSLSEADTASCLERHGCVIDTGPTGTNVMDVVLVRAPGV